MNISPPAQRAFRRFGKIRKTLGSRRRCPHPGSHLITKCHFCLSWNGNPRLILRLLKNIPGLYSFAANRNRERQIYSTYRWQMSWSVHLPDRSTNSLALIGHIASSRKGKPEKPQQIKSRRNQDKVNDSNFVFHDSHDPSRNVTGFFPHTVVRVIRDSTRYVSDSIFFHSSGGSWSFAEAMFSSRCARDDVPGIGSITGERWSNQASASCTTLTP